MKLAIFINMRPKGYEDVGMQMPCGRKLSYEQLRDHISGTADQKAQLSRPVPMDTNSVDVRPGDEGLWDEGSWDDWGVDAVSMNTQCYACWGYEHLARHFLIDEKRKGKGEKVEKGKGKGEYSGKGGKGDYKGKGKGKGEHGGKGGGLQRERKGQRQR